MDGEHLYIVVGHFNPVGAYPAYVIPVVSVDGGHFAVFLSRERSLTLRPVSNFVLERPSALREGAGVFVSESVSVRLFAFSEGESILYGANESLDFWVHAVNTAHLLERSPFTAIDIAVDTGQRGCIIVALSACIAAFKEAGRAEVLIDNWYASQVGEIQREVGAQLELPALWAELEVSTLLLREVDLVGVQLEYRSAEEHLARHELEVRGPRLERSTSRRLVDTLLQLTGDRCISREQGSAWHAFFEYYVQGFEPSLIARRLHLPSVSTVREYAERGLTAFLEVFHEQQARNPALRGLTSSGLRMAFESSRIAPRPQGIDIVFCVDVTGSMQPFIDAARGIVSTFHERLADGLRFRGFTVAQIRARVVAFEDFYHDQVPLRETSFMMLPQEAWAFQSIINGLVPGDGGDTPECGLEAISIAMDSQWMAGGPDSAQIIMLFTDAPAHPLERSTQSPPSNYPLGIPRSLEELAEKWDFFCARSTAAVQRLVMFAPDAYPWDVIGSSWRNSLHLISKAGHGLRAVPEDLVVESISRGLG